VTLRLCLACNGHHPSGYSCSRYQLSAARKARAVDTPGALLVKQRGREMGSDAGSAVTRRACRITTSPRSAKVASGTHCQT
jgi:hypothetical protein